MRSDPNTARRGSLRLAFTLLVVSFLPGFASSAAAQTTKAKKPTIPKPEMLSFEGLGGVTIQYTYLAGGFIQKTDTEITTKPGKEVVPIILLHGFEGRGADLMPLALTLQRQGHAVVVPDLRGHGTSRYRVRGREDQPPAKLNRQDFNAMVGDVEVLKKFYYEKNNQGQVNVESLCLMGADLGAAVATNWIALDWSKPDLPAFRQGKSAKALVVLSPVGSVKGYTANPAWKHEIFLTPARMSIMLVAGSRDGKSSSEARQIFNRIEKWHLTDPAAADKSRQSLWLIEPDTDLTGGKLVDPRARLSVTQLIVAFVKSRLADRQAEFPWSERRSPLDAQ
ncbi:MAG: alpha/beta hydrolase [Pirellulaceae bacterium]